MKEERHWLQDATEEQLERMWAEEQAEEDRQEQEAIDNAEEEESMRAAENAEEDALIAEGEIIHDFFHAFSEAIKCFKNMTNEASERLFTEHDEVATHIYAIDDYYKSLQKKFPEVAKRYK